MAIATRPEVAAPETGRSSSRTPASGAFVQTLSLGPGELPPGAQLFPGGFVVSVTGTTGGFQLPLQLKTVVLRSPSEGVVRQAFPSASQESGAQLRFRRGTKEVWANFRFATQPLRRLPVTVTWYRPNGSKLGTVTKANQPEVESFLRFGPGLPSGLWTAELRAGRTSCQAPRRSNLVRDPSRYAFFFIKKNIRSHRSARRGSSGTRPEEIGVGQCHTCRDDRQDCRQAGRARSIDVFLERAAEGPRAFVLEGEPGIGKSPRWHAGVEGART